MGEMILEFQKVRISHNIGTFINLYSTNFTDFGLTLRIDEVNFYFFNCTSYCNPPAVYKITQKIVHMFISIAQTA